MLGIFDSGCGGLTVLRAIRELLPDRAMTYLGDNARLPYGEKSRGEVTQYTKECCSVLFERGCTLIVLACNTASADTLHSLQQEWLPHFAPLRGASTFAKAMVDRSAGKPRNIIGVIRPLVEEAVLRTKNNRIAIVGTRSTIASTAYERELKKLKPEVTVIPQACPLLVPLVEEGWIEKSETRRILRSYLAPLKSQNPDVLILGCTHYEVLHPFFQRKMGRRCAVLHAPTIIAAKLKEYLERHPEYDCSIPRTGETVFLTTGDPDRFREIGRMFYGAEIKTIEKVTV